MIVSEYQFTDDEGNTMPVITLEIMSSSSSTDDAHSNTDMQNSMDSTPEKVEEMSNEDTEIIRTSRSDLLEYMLRSDGSVVCKLCGEVLQSRTHWYRHKYKLHSNPPPNPGPLFQCEQCLGFFKSRKGYIGHVASKHSETLSDSSPVLTNSQAEAIAKEKNGQTEQQPSEDKEKEQDQPDPELAIPRTCVLNYQTTVVKQASTGKYSEVKKLLRRTSKDSQVTNQADMDEKRSREEKLVADIIDRVRRECEAQGSGGAARRGYTRRYTASATHT